MNILHLEYKKETGMNIEASIEVEFRLANKIRNNRIIIETDEIQKNDLAIELDDEIFLTTPTKSYIKWLENKAGQFESKLINKTE
jgi:hypothetical protein